MRFFHSITKIIREGHDFFFVLFCCDICMSEGEMVFIDKSEQIPDGKKSAKNPLEILNFLNGSITDTKSVRNFRRIGEGLHVPSGIFR